MSRPVCVSSRAAASPHKSSARKRTLARSGSSISVSVAKDSRSRDSDQSSTPSVKANRATVSSSQAPDLTRPRTSSESRSLCWRAISLLVAIPRAIPDAQRRIPPNSTRSGERQNPRARERIAYVSIDTLLIHYLKSVYHDCNPPSTTRLTKRLVCGTLGNRLDQSVCARSFGGRE